ncbi:nucleolar pre-ribosomal-associated protein 1 [Ambystoma mexicanum]|uniref:nucleolar pre-ribosomal-associated protein 1 n=1 Tax=Ambystoma mexicanum TaxID=8296 RepID=UPI0037E92722
MASKRMRAASTGLGPVGKKPKNSQEEFTGASFKTQLKNPQEAMKGLEMFISLARKLPCGDLYDVVEGYLKISMECAEILNLLDGEKRPESEMLLIFQALEAILLRTASDLSHFSVVGMNIVRKIINVYMKVLYTSLYSQSHRTARACLNLMSAMVTQGPDSAREFFSQFDFHNKFLSGLLNKRDKQGRPDVRMAYIQFAVAFLIAGDHTTIVQLLELKDFIPDIFNTGIKEDRISTINLLLSSLETKVVRNKDISKTQKVHFFTSNVLNQIASLYRWNGIVDVSTDDIEASQQHGEAGKHIIRELVHNFLMELCCSLKHGINFYDPSLGTAGRAGNLVLLRFLVGLKFAPQDEMVAELVVSILKVCPDLLSRYFKETQYSFVPRLKTAWLDNVTFLKKIYEGQPEVSNAFKTAEFIPLSRLLSMVMVTTVPPICNKAMFTQGLNLPNHIVKYTTLSLLSSILRRAQNTIDHCLNEELWKKSEIYSPALMEEFSQKFREALSKLLPDINTIVSTWNSLIKQEQTEQGDKKGDTKAIPAVEEVGFSGDEAETTLLKASILHAICLYQKVVPHLVAQSPFDFSKLLKGIVIEKGTEKQMPPVLQYNILQVALELPANKFSWFNAQDANKVCGEKSVFCLLLKMFVTSKNSQLKTSTKLLIVKILRDSGVFEHTWKELDLWLEHLDKIEDHNEIVIHFLERILVKLMSNPHPYTDRAADAVQDASVLQVNMVQHDSDSVSVPISHIDDVLDMVDVIVEGSEGLDEEIGFSMNEDMILNTFPFSAVVPASLETRNALLLQGGQKIDGVLSYLAVVLTDILHSQRDPLALCLLLQTYDKELNSLHMNQPQYSHIFQFNSYYKLWIPKQVKETLFKHPKESCISHNPSDECSFSSLLRTAYESDKDLLLDNTTNKQLKESISKIKLCELLLAVKQVMLYLKTTVDNFSKLSRDHGSALIDFFMDLLYLLICQFNQAKEVHQQTDCGHHAESDLFLDTESVSSAHPLGHEVLQDMLTTILKHPVLENWFLALELQIVPQHALNPVTVKQLSGHLNHGIINLLKLSAPMLVHLNCQSTFYKYLEVVVRCITKELNDRQSGSSRMAEKMSQSLVALQDLHPYLDTSLLKEVTLAMLQLPENDLTVKKSKSETAVEKGLSFYGESLVQLLTESYQRQPTKGTLVISAEHIKGLGILLSTSSSEDLGKVLCCALQKEPAFAHVVSVDVLMHCLNHMTETCLSIGALLVQHSRPHLFQFELWCLNEGQTKHLKRNMDAYLDVIDVYLECREQYNFSRPLQVSSAALHVLQDAFWSKLVNVALTNTANETHSLQLKVIAKLIPATNEEALAVIIEKLPGILAQPENQESWVLADAVSSVLKNAAEQAEAWRKKLLSACMKCLTASFISNKDQKTMPDIESSIVVRLEELLHYIKEVDPAEWNNFVKAGLKYHYRDCNFQRTLKVAIHILYVKESQALIPLPMVHMMITQHSLFLPTILRSREEESIDTHTVREALVDVLSAIVEKCPSVCNVNHFAVLLGAYSATLSVTDQKILLLLQMYEKNKLSLADFRLLLWGPAAVEHHKTRKSLGQSLWQQPSTEEILCLLDQDKMNRTVIHFPLHRHLHLEDGQGMLYKEHHMKDVHDLYDPSFLLPLFCELIRPEFVVDCRKFVEVNALGVTVAALSSYDSSMRAAAYYVLGSFYANLEGARFRDRKQLLYLMDVVKNGIRQQNLRLAFPLSLYIAKSAQQCMKPEDHMYIRINKFLLMHQYLDLLKVPDFHKLFFSFDSEHKVEREWTLQLLVDGLQDNTCYELYDYQRIFQILLTFYNGPLCVESNQEKIFEILQKAATVTKAAFELIRDHSLLTWILHLLDKRFHDNRMLASIVTLLSNLWQTILGDKESDKKSGSLSKKVPQEKQKLLPLQIINEFLHLHVKLIQHIQTNLDLGHLAQFFGSMSSILRYRATVMEEFKEMARFTLNESVFSSTDILMLLHKWSIIEKDMELQGDLHALAERFKVTELLKAVKEKNKPQSQGWSSSRQSRKKKELDTEEKVDELKKDAYLRTCKEHLESIFLHWEPAFPTPSAEEDGMKESQADANGLVCRATFITVKWVLKSMSTESFTWQNVSGMLQWLKTDILPHAPVTEQIAGDCVLKSALFKIYNRANDVGVMMTFNYEVLHLFNTIMIQLLDVQGLQEHGFHRSVQEFCHRAANENDEQKKASLVFFISTYIGDMWLGAKQPEKFAIHVGAICDSINEKCVYRKENTPKRKRQQQAEDVVVTVCKDMSAAVLVH